MKNAKVQTINRFGVSKEIVAPMLTHGNPSIRRAGKLLAQMVERHDRGDYNRAMDMQTIDNIQDLIPREYPVQFTNRGS